MIDENGGRKGLAQEIERYSIKDMLFINKLRICPNVYLLAYISQERKRRGGDG